MNPLKRQVHAKLAYGAVALCSSDASGQVAIVHACKDPCHKTAVGYHGSLPNTHPHYLFLEEDYHLYLNLIDPPKPLFMLASFTIFLDFVERHIVEREVVIHCNLGESRAPSLALLYLAKRLGTLPADTYEAARGAFIEQFGAYVPGLGIQTWLTENWNRIE